MAIYGTYSEKAVSNTIDKTATAVFVYDTSQDSDSGEWRTRTQHTSWYNETLGTSTRGSRRDFPAVAILIAEENKLTIYDGDDPDHPMWMVFESQDAIGLNSHMIPRGASSSRSDITSIACLNGKLVVGLKDVDGTVGEGLVEINFIPDYARIYRETGSSYTGSIFALPISGRNINADYLGDFDTFGVTAQTVNHVAMKVLPNSPVDPATGLPIPTIAFAHDTGVSVIKGHNTDGATSGFEVINKVANHADTDVPSVEFTEDGNLMVNRDDYAYHVITPVDGAQSESNPSGWTNNILYFREQAGQYPAPMGPGGDQNYGDINKIAPLKGSDTATADDKGLNIFSVDLSLGNNKNMVAYVTDEFNTGHLVGNTELATLSDTVTTQPSELITNGTFDSDISNWTGYNAVLTHQTDAIRIADNGSFSKAYQAFTTVVGKSYQVKVVVKTISGGAAHCNTGSQDPAQTSGNDFTIFTNATSTGTYYNTFTANSTTTYVEVWSDGTNYVEYSEVSVKEAIQDRSNPSPKGFCAKGTITKTAVNTGAELVAYSGFSEYNVISQSYNSNLNPGTNTYSFACWFKCSDTSSEQVIMRRFSTSSVTGGQIVRILSSSSKMSWYVRDTSGSSTTLESMEAVDDGNWHCMVGTRDTTSTKLYIDGKLNASGTCSANSHNAGSDANFVIGAEETVGSPGTYANPASACSLALVRFSKTAPTEAQVEKMYNDEKALFQVNANATLYGSSKVTTALAYDKAADILHVGTSSGRSEFQGLQRINNTTTTVTTAISAHDRLIVEQ